MDLLLRGGEVVDGTGAPARSADVRISRGMITEIGESLRPDGAREIDATGGYVTPGFIDIHTHFDASLFWDPFCDPMGLHGVTSLLYGNCSLSLAPCHERDRAELTALLCYIEDLPEAALAEAVPWTWERYPELVDEIGAREFGLNIAGLVGHTPLRLFVMGAEAWERPATEAERSRISALADECLQAGAFGMSTSIGFDEDRNKRPVPSRIADDAEFDALIDVLADRGRFLQFISDPYAKRTPASVRRLASLCARRGLVSTWINVMHDDQLPELALSLMDLAAELQADGSPCYPQISPRPMDIQVNWFGGMSFFTMKDSWHAMVQTMDPEAKAALLADAQWRASARADWERVPFTMIRHRLPHKVRLLSVTRPEHEVWLNRTLADLVDARGGHPSDVLADWILDNDLRPGVVGSGVGNGDPDGVAALLKHPAGVLANSDAGAHLQMFSAAGDSTLLLTEFTRDRRDLTIEEAVHKLTGRLAGLFGFDGRGVLCEGTVADVNVFALDELRWGPEAFVADLPTGARRLRRPAGGYRATMVGGVVTQEHGTSTGATPGRLLRSAR
ncbi:MAG: Amidohydrolase 3 [Ilumatobacteraceae bacterium]|nr:Amidohydrolase 3 [Ilumatobacteraceae bacterium]